MRSRENHKREEDLLPTEDLKEYIGETVSNNGWPSTAFQSSFWELFPERRRGVGSNSKIGSENLSQNRIHRCAPLRVT